MINYLPFLFFIVCSILSFLYYHNIFFLIFIIIILIIIRKIKFNYLFIFLIIIIGYILLFNYNLEKPIISKKEFIINHVTKSSYYAKNNEGKILLRSNTQLNKNDVVLVKCELKEINTYKNFNLFNYQDYLISNKIFYECNDNNVKVLKRAEIKQNDKISNYFNYLFFMDKSNINEEVIDSLIELSIIHIVVVSGFHFNLIYKILDNTFFFINKSLIKKIIIILILFAYLHQLDYSYPSLRAFLMILFINIPFLNKYKQLNLLCLIGLLILLINPLAILSMSYILTFFITFVIVVLDKRFKKNKLIFSIIVYYSIVPLIASMNYAVSVFGIITTFIFTPIILVLFFFVALGNFIPFFIPFTLKIITLFEEIILNINSHNILVNTGSLPWIIIVIYFMILIYVIKNLHKNKLLITLPLNLIIIYSMLPSFFGFVSYLDVGQGDCIIIKPFLSNEAMMIDVAKPYQSNTVNNIIIPYLKSHKIKKINKLIITHDDLDHSGGKDDLKKSFQVTKIIERKQKYYRFNSFLFIDLLYNKKYSNKNSNSITLYSRINGLNYFFSGDIDANTELDLYEVVKELPVDILKVAHHGSKTSSSDKFLDLTNPSIAIAQLKKNNRYNHPHPEVVKRFKDRNIVFYNTGDHGSIKIYFTPLFNYFKKYQ